MAFGFPFFGTEQRLAQLAGPRYFFPPTFPGGKGQTNDADASEKFVCPNQQQKACVCFISVRLEGQPCWAFEKM